MVLFFENFPSNFFGCSEYFSLDLQFLKNELLCREIKHFESVKKTNGESEKPQDFSLRGNTKKNDYFSAISRRAKYELV